MKKSFMKRGLSLLLALAMVAGMMPANALEAKAADSAINAVAGEEMPLQNAAAPLTIPTFDATGKVTGETHPDVLYFEEGWHGYKYYMVVTPNQNGNSQYENPCLIASNDGINWENVPGLTAPLTGVKEEPRPYHNCDADLVYDESTDKIFLYYNWVNDGDVNAKAEIRVFEIGYDNGFYSVSGETPICAIVTDMRYDALSPSIVVRDGKWEMWAVDTKDVGWQGQENFIEYRTSNDGINWSEPTSLATTFDQPGYIFWHIDVQWVPEAGENGEYWAIYPAYPDGGNSTATWLFYAKSEDGQHWTTYEKPILSPQGGSTWDRNFIYRSTFLYDNANDQNMFRVWYASGYANVFEAGAWAIGYTENEYSDMIAAIGNTTSTTGTAPAKPEVGTIAATDYTALNNAITASKEKYDKNNYTEDSWALYAEGLALAEATAENTNAKQAEVNALVTELKRVERRLVKVTQSAGVGDYLSDLDWAEQSCGASGDFPNGTARDTNIGGAPITLLVDGDETIFGKGLGIHAPSSVTYNIAGKGYTSFEAYAGVDYSQVNSYPGEAIIGNFIVEIDGTIVEESGAMNPTMDAYHFQVNIPADAQTITLRTEIGDAQDWSDWGDWADAKFMVDLGEAENVALNKNVTVKWAADDSNASVNSERPAAMAVDGVKNNTQANYCDFGEDNRTDSVYMQIDLGQSYLINEVNLWRYWQDGRTYKGTVIALSETEDFANPTIVYNSDAENHHGFGIGEDATYVETADGMSMPLSKLTNARYVRIYVHGSDRGNTNHIVEVEVMGYDVRESQKPVGPTLEPVEGNEIQVHVEEGKVNLYRGDTLVATSASLGKVTANGRTVSDFTITDSEIMENVETARGMANRLVLVMYSESAKIEKTLWIDLLEDVDGAIYTTTFLKAEEDVTITDVVENEFRLVEPDKDRIWSYNGGGEGTQSWYDTLQKVSNGFSRENKQDETAAAIPVADIYSVNGGVLVGDAALYRKFLTTPVRGSNNTATISIQWKSSQNLTANTEKEVGTAIVSVHDGDYYNALRTYADVMETQGFSTPDYIPESSYDLRWESWGWEGAWTIDRILGKLDALYDQGIRQITLDDCWYTSAGDWELNPAKFPNGVADMKRLTDAIHEKGMTIVLWWRPMDGGRNTAFSVLAGFTQQPSELLEEHPEYFVKNADGSFAKLSGPGSHDSFNGSTGYALCPQSEGAVESQKAFIRRAMTEWGIDGFKSDYVWGMPKCYNEAHNHERPEESTETASDVFYKAIYEEMISIDEDAFHLLCNCGTPQDYYSFPYVTQIPTADPTSVDQTRRRVKAYKALAGDDFPITTDHNEIWYPSSVGTGAILIEKRDFAAGSSQEVEYYKWLNIADTHELHKGTHIGDLYAYGIDSYETYVIEKDGMMYYSFYRDGKYRPSGNPEIVLKGLDPNKTYRIEDYVNNQVLAENVSGASAVLNTQFSSYLLIRAVEEAPVVPPVDKSELADAIQEAEAIEAEGYTAESYAALEAVIAAAKEVLDAEDATQEAVDAAIAELEAVVEALEEEVVFVNPFEDVYETDYYYDPVMWAVEQGITDGWTETLYAPEMGCTRGQVVTFLWRAAGEPEAENAENPFTDVAENAYYYDAVLWAVEEGITDGWTATTFAPEMTCTRGQIVTFIWRAADKPEAEDAANPFEDVAENAYYYDAVLWAVEEQITDGWTDTTFEPEMDCTRGQIVTFLYRYYN